MREQPLVNEIPVGQRPVQIPAPLRPGSFVRHHPEAMAETSVGVAIFRGPDVFAACNVCHDPKLTEQLLGAKGAT